MVVLPKESRIDPIYKKTARTVRKFNPTGQSGYFFVLGYNQQALKPGLEVLTQEGFDIFMEEKTICMEKKPKEMGGIGGKSRLVMGSPWVPRASRKIWDEFRVSIDCMFEFLGQCMANLVCRCFVRAISGYAFPLRGMLVMPLESHSRCLRDFREAI
ncbi:hypothetical protein CRG98_003624 [Punica granatum]|uniref:Uncharacterized protein n=1 Tax=Punica granatum TaxID=22663 RepID=A0A2I0L779_PUNGR|nr:hypothetical protein CRG98_003624 [Punica granatum]